MKRATSIEALLAKAKRDSGELKATYESSLREKHVREDLKIAIKNIFENLRSCLDYMAQDVFETHCSTATKPDRLYFPIRPSHAEFVSTAARDYPGLSLTSPDVFATIEAVQPYHDPWLRQFNMLNNHNKHQGLVEQSRTEMRQVTVSRGGGAVSWGPGVIFGSGVSVMEVPIDPRTQMPVPNSVTETTVVTWVDFRFKEIDYSVLPFVEVSTNKVNELFIALRSHV